MNETTGPTAYPLDRDVLIAAGPDATDYLQGQISQDVTAMTEGDSRWSFVLAPNGKVTAWFRISRRADDWVLDVDAGFGDALEARLTRFLLRTDAAVSAAQWQGVAVRGPGSRAAVDLESLPAGAIVADPAWPGFEGLDLLGPTVAAPTGLPEGMSEQLETLRIQAGVPAMATEFDESTIPAASGVVERSVSFTKGCFTGQELVARINSRGGTTPTRLCGVRAPEGVALAPGDELQADGAVVATVTSVVPTADEGLVGLAYVKRAVDVDGEMPVGVAGAAGTGGGRIRLVPLPAP